MRSGSQMYLHKMVTEYAWQRVRNEVNAPQPLQESLLEKEESGCCGFFAKKPAKITKNSEVSQNQAAPSSQQMK